MDYQRIKGPSPQVESLSSVQMSFNNSYTPDPPSSGSTGTPGGKNLKNIFKRKPTPYTADPIFELDSLVHRETEQQDSPQPLRRPWRAGLAISIGMMLMAVPFLVYAGMAWHVHGKEVKNDQWDTLHQMGNKLGTLFPIVFALIVAQALIRVAAWRLERGTTLGSLEQIVASLTVGSAVSTLISLRRLNMITVILLLVWALSPVGSQANIQMLTTRDSLLTTTRSARYFDIDTSPIGFQSGDIWMQPALFAMFDSVLMAPASVRTSSMDLWGNVKIPDISRLTSDTDSAEWVEVTNSSDVQYSSILGIPLRDIPEEGNTTFFAETSYISLNCEGLSEITSDTDLNVTTLEGLKVPTTGIKPNGTYYGISVETDSWAMALNGFLGGGPYGTIIGLENSTTEYAPFTLRFDSPLGNVTIHCPLTTTYIESHVQCYDQSCAVTSLRPSQLHHPSRNLTNLGYYGAFLEFTLYLTNATMTGLHSGTESALELFLADPDLTTQAGLAWPTISNVSLSDFELRLQQIINAFWFGSYDPTSVMGGNLNMTGASMVFDTVPGSHSQFKRIYHCNITWLTLAIVSASVMLLAAAFVGVLGFVTRGPQVLGYVSGALRDNPYIIPGLKTEKGNGYYDVNHAETVSGSEGGGRALKFSNTIPTPSRISAPMKVNSTIGGMSRSRKLQNLQIRLQDVDPNSEVGHIAISRCGDGLGDGICDNGGNQGDLNSRDRKSDVGQLKAGRLYH